MVTGAGSCEKTLFCWLRALPLAVVGFFLAASAIPRWVVPPPAYDLLLRTTGYPNQAAPRVAVDFVVRDERVEARVRALPAAAGVYPQVPKLSSSTTRR